MATNSVGSPEAVTSLQRSPEAIAEGSGAAVAGPRIEASAVVPNLDRIKAAVQMMNTQPVLADDDAWDQELWDEMIDSIPGLIAVVEDAGRWLVPIPHRPNCPLTNEPCTSWTCLVDTCSR